MTRRFKTDATGAVTYDRKLYWKSLSQLGSVWTSGVGTIGYGYDGWGKRVRRTDQFGTGMQYVYDGDDLLLEADGAGAPIQEFAHYPGIDQPHSLRQWAGGAGGATYYYAQEHPGDVSGLIDGASNLANHYRYTPFGAAQPRFPQENTTNPLRFQGREIDGTTQLYYFRSRWYDPELARFVSEDPIGLAGGINPYVFAGNNPVNFRDPLGLQSCPEGLVQTVNAQGKPDCAVPIGGVTGGGSGGEASDPCRRGACWPRGGGAGGVPVAGPRGGG